MNELLSLLSRYGYLLILANLFLESVGLPIPAAPILVAAGAAAAFGSLKILNVLIIALAACMLGDFLLFLAGRYTGWAILGFLCRLSVNPETFPQSSHRLFNFPRLLRADCLGLPHSSFDFAENKLTQPKTSRQMNTALLGRWGNCVSQGHDQQSKYRKGI